MANNDEDLRVFRQKILWYFVRSIINNPPTQASEISEFKKYKDRVITLSPAPRNGYGGARLISEKIEWP